MIISNLIFGFTLIFLILLFSTAVIHMAYITPFVPTRMKVVRKMVKVAGLKPKETVFDLGCGDGRLLIEAEKTARVKTVGFEIAPLVYIFAWVRKIFARSRMSLQFKSFFSAPLKNADVIFCYLIPTVMPRLAEKMKRECKRGTRIISNTFHIPGLTPVQILKKNLREHTPTIYVYRI